MNFTNYSNVLGIFFYLIPTVCTLCYSLSLFIKKDRTLPQIYLAISILVFGIGMAVFFIYDCFFAEDNEITCVIDLFFVTIGGVFAMTYFVSLIDPRKLTSRYFIFHIAATLVFLLLILITGMKFGIILWACYIIYATTSMYIRYNRLLRQHHFYEKQVNSRKIAWYIVFFVIYAIADIFKIFDPSILMRIIFNVGSVLTLTCIFVLGFRQEMIPTMEELINTTDTDTGYLDKQQENLSQIESKLKIYFAKQKPYLNPELSLSDVAASVRVNTTYLSRLINQRLNVNFFTFVNGYRINHSIYLIEERKGCITSDLLYMESGFKSRSVFYKLFNERTGFSPQEYIKNHYGQVKK